MVTSSLRSSFPMKGPEDCSRLPKISPYWSNHIQTYPTLSCLFDTACHSLVSECIPKISSHCSTYRLSFIGRFKQHLPMKPQRSLPADIIILLLRSSYIKQCMCKTFRTLWGVYNVIFNMIEHSSFFSCTCIVCVCLLHLTLNCLKAGTGFISCLVDCLGIINTSIHVVQTCTSHFIIFLLQKQSP